MRGCRPETGHQNCVRLREGLNEVLEMPLDDPEWDEDPWQSQDIKKFKAGARP